jgi:hypothetical protein
MIAAASGLDAMKASITGGCIDRLEGLASFGRLDMQLHALVLQLPDRRLGRLSVSGIASCSALPRPPAIASRSSSGRPSTSRVDVEVEVDGEEGRHRAVLLHLEELAAVGGGDVGEAGVDDPCLQRLVDLGARHGGGRRAGRDQALVDQAVEAADLDALEVIEVTSGLLLEVKIDWRVV